MSSKLPEERKSIIRGFIDLGLDFAAVYTARKNEAKTKKNLTLFKEKKTDILKQNLISEDYLNKLEGGVYDDGYAIICGTIRQKKCRF